MKSLRWEHFKGTHREVGFALGLYWAVELRRTKKTERTCAFLQEFCSQPLHDNEMTPQHKRLIRHLRTKHPELIEEIEGMSEGLRQSGLPANFYGLFKWSLGEAHRHFGGCSTLAYLGNGFAALAHNEEDVDGLFPLCFANVSIRHRNAYSEFISVSYPFQLFGSAVGATAAVAFTGNSIFTRPRPPNDYKTRLPKTVFTRLALQQQSADAVADLFDNSLSILPGHWYVANCNKIRSIEVRPYSASRKPRIRLVEARECHTNHFRDDRDPTDDRDPKNESIGRLRRLEKFARQELGETSHRGGVVGEAGYLLKPLLRLRDATQDGRESTSASVLCAVDEIGVVVEARDHYRNGILPKVCLRRPERVGRISAAQSANPL